MRPNPAPPPAQTPAAALWLGIAGLLPFVLLAAWRIHDPQGPGIVHIALVAYGAVILTFVGALHWGFAMLLPRTSRKEQWLLMGWSTLPALAAWSAMIVPANVDLGLLIAVFWLHYAFDMTVARRRHLPAWYLPLRTLLTLGATLSLLAVLVFANIPGPSRLLPNGMMIPHPLPPRMQQF